MLSVISGCLGSFVIIFTVLESGPAMFTKEYPTFKVAVLPLGITVCDNSGVKQEQERITLLTIKSDLPLFVNVNFATGELNNFTFPKSISGEFKTNFGAFFNAFLSKF